MPIVAGGTSAHGQLINRTRRVSPRRSAASLTTHTAAASFCPLALPAVTLAFGSPRPC